MPLEIWLLRILIVLRCLPRHREFRAEQVRDGRPGGAVGFACRGLNDCGLRTVF
jgi:hypothetical protein